MRREREQRSAGAYAVSVAVHVVAGAALLWVLSIPIPLRQWLSPAHAGAPRAERVVFVGVPAGLPTGRPRSGGNGRPPQGALPQPSTLVAPTEIPTAPIVTKPGPAVPEQGTGPTVIAGGAGPGIMPMMRDPRIWVPPGAVVVAPLSDSARLDSAWHEAFGHMRDSLTHGAAGKALAGVFSAGGKKYGIDSSNIYIADYKIPAALLAVLPIHPTGAAPQEQTVLNRQIAEINYDAGRALDAEDFKAAIKRIRQRKEREKRARDAAMGKAVAAAPTDPPDPVRKLPQKDPTALQTP